MTLDPTLLDKARRDAATLAEAERQLLLAKSDYYSAIRRLHLAGATLREIGEALGLSHQRVQQIVDEAGGSWWQRLRGRKSSRVAICSFCNRPPSEVAKLIAGPDAHICDCDACIARAEAIAAGRPAGGEAWTLETNSRAVCAFCHLRRSKTATMVAGPERICGDCLALCRQILDGRAA
jgi:hypothetical protein